MIETKHAGKINEMKRQLLQIVSNDAPNIHTGVVVWWWWGDSIIQ